GHTLRLSVLFVSACAALALAGAARSGLSLGVSEDRGKGTDPAAFFATLNDLGLSQNRASIVWDPAQPDTIAGQADIQHSLPLARSNRSRSPVRFLHDLGVAYRASRRTKPLMDELAFHPYPHYNTDPPDFGYAWPNAGIPNLGRIKQAVWDAFNRTAQPTFAESGTESMSPLQLELDEIGW